MIKLVRDKKKRFNYCPYLEGYNIDYFLCKILLFNIQHSEVNENNFYGD